MEKNPLGGGTSSHEGHGHKNQGGKGKETGSTSGKTLCHHGRKINAEILHNTIQAYYVVTPIRA